MQNLLVCQKKVKQYKIDRAADDVNVIRCQIMNGKQSLSMSALCQCERLILRCWYFLIVIGVTKASNSTVPSSLSKAGAWHL